jgi:hypothetical protein
MRDPDLAHVAARFIERKRTPDARRPNPPAHYGAGLTVVWAPSPGKYGYFDVVLIKKDNYSGTNAKPASTIIQAWRNRKAVRGDPTSELSLALNEAYALRAELEAELKVYPR